RAGKSAARRNRPTANNECSEGLEIGAPVIDEQRIGTRNRCGRRRKEKTVGCGVVGVGTVSSSVEKGQPGDGDRPRERARIINELHLVRTSERNAILIVGGSDEHASLGGAGAY